MKALITAGGRATRLRPITHTINKHLIPLANQPMIFYALEKVVEVGIKDIYININPGDKEIPAAVGDGERFGARVHYIEQTGGPQGVAHIIANAAPYLANSSFLFYFGDNILLGDLGSLLTKFQKEKLNCLLAFAQVKDPGRFGVPVIKDGRLLKVIEKPAAPPCNLAQAGIYFYDQSIFEAVKNIAPSARGELEISDANTYLIEQGFQVGYEEITGWWKDTGLPDDLLEANAILLDQKVSQTPEVSGAISRETQIKGGVKIGAGSQVLGNSELRGPLIIGENCLIDNSSLGPAVAIGSGTIIKNSQIINSLIMAGVEVQAARLKDSILGQGTKVTAHGGSVTSRVLVGDNSVIEGPS